MSDLYDLTSAKSIIDFAKKLQNNSLRIACDSQVINHGYQGKGYFGQILEDFYFQYKPNSDSEPDFKVAGLELKSSPLKRLKNKQFRAKERLVLNIINYLEEANQTFEASSFWHKNAHLLLVFYLHQANANVLDLMIKLVDNWQFPEDDLAIIKQDWALIQRKINNGKAHELSEGDTFYLGACTKGAKGGSPRPQHNSNIKAKQRAYSLKQGYVNHIVATISKDASEIYGKLISAPDILKKQTLESVVVSKFQPFYGKTVDELVDIFKFKQHISVKSFYANLTNAILDVELGRKIEEFEKAEIQVKTVRLNNNNMPFEDISFPCFKYEVLALEDWDDAPIKAKLEQKFLFIFFKKIDGRLILQKATFWNMPYADLLEVEKVWLETKRIVNAGEIVKKVDGNRRYTNFPSKKHSQVSHVRPHAKNANDTYILPVIDKVTGVQEYTKHCIWLNNSYIRDQIYLKAL